MHTSMPVMPTLPADPAPVLLQRSDQTRNTIYLKHIDPPVSDQSKRLADRKGQQVSLDGTALTRLLSEKQAIMAIYNTVRERLGPMGKVAEYKRILNKAIFDQSREEKVLNATASLANKNGIHIESYKAFIQANMDAAKEIQHAHPGSSDHKKPSEITNGERQNAMAQLELIRGQLIEMGNKMAVLVGEYLKNQGPFKKSMEEVFIAHLGVDHLPDKNKVELFEKLLAVSAATEKQTQVSDLT